MMLTKVGLHSCIARTLVESESFNSRWVFRNHANIDYFDPATFFHTLSGTGINKILFAGDSITDQTFKFLLCDMLRLENVTVIHQDELSATVTVNGITISALKIRSLMINAISMQKKLAIDEDLHAFVDKLFLEISLKRSVSGRTLLIFNQGLHIQTTDNSDKIIQYFSTKLIQFAKTDLNEFYVMFRETSAQHFPKLPGGDYDISMNSKQFPYAPNEFCCYKNQNLETIHKANWRNRKFHDYMTQSDSLWNTYIGWLPFFNFTARLDDTHVDVTQKLYVDCTHFAYFPFLFAPLWYDIEDKLNRLVDLRPRIPYNTSLIINMNGSDIRMHIKRHSGKDIYLYENGKKRLYSSWEVFVKHRKNINDVVEFSRVEIDNIPDGAMIVE